MKVKVEVTGAKEVDNRPVSHNGNLRAGTNPQPRSVKIPLAVTLYL